jgi:hypothetical protein
MLKETVCAVIALMDIINLPTLTLVLLASPNWHHVVMASMRVHHQAAQPFACAQTAPMDNTKTKKLTPNNHARLTLLAMPVHMDLQQQQLPTVHVHLVKMDIKVKMVLPVLHARPIWRHVVLARILQYCQMLKQTVFATTALMNFTNLPVLSQALHALHGAPVLLEDLW